ncbi:leucine-rich repeat domain-containing protein [Methanococcoides alaskense]|uniref:non-specific serine/threonine protein kinase n=1 Tax=Methanococcoides alaskense TaxID=325778 RepID=A0AA90TY39_9EURY|nr:leucine-rich repeat domain-containing protein [Methanococcoides alaskense]MDA0525292.1 leucine-rich repeat domain-containing protein [Methanococcoides alaskense]MDR6221784.1 small GTP-binding protein [Methanococcoides alaskense]
MTNEKVMQLIREAALNNLTTLYLSNNKLTQLPPEIVEIKNLRILFLSNNRFTQFPMELVELKNLIVLDLSSNRLTQFPMELVELKNLKTLFLSDNQFTQLPPEIVELTNLTTLDLSGNQLTQLPPEIVEFKNLTTLDLSGNQLTQLPLEIVELKNLTTLVLSDNQLTQLPLEIVELTNLTTLELSNNQLTQLPPEIVELTNLTTLELSNNQLTQLPSEIVELTNLTTLDLSNNQLTQLPQEIIYLQNLTNFHLIGNKLKQLPMELGELKNLTILDLSGNWLKQLPMELAELKNLTRLYLASNRLKQLPIELGELKNLTELSLSDNQLLQLPPEIVELKNLTILDLSDNQLTQLPPEIVELKNLTELSLSDNKLTQLPSEIVELKNLTTLDLSANQLTQFPMEIVELKNLTVLALGANELTQLPIELGELKNLTALYLYFNKLTQLPSEIAELKNLTTLELSNNQLTQLPPKIIELGLDFKFNFADFDGIFLQENPLENPPIDIIKRGRSALVEYFSSLENEEKMPINEVKVLLVGYGGAGKTSLVKRLVDDKFNEHESQTPGISITNWNVTEKDKDIKINLWDFGGQEIMHATHQFFLSKRSLYILVLDGRKDEKTEYWLKHIESLGGDSPIFVVLNKIDENPGFEVNRKFLQDKYPSISDFYPISCKDNEGINILFSDLKKELVNIKHIETTWPKSWFNVKNKLENMTQHFISYNNYKQICNEEGITENTAQTTLIDFLNDLGIALNFKDFDLKDTHVLEPKWITSAVYKIINSKKLANCNGVLDLKFIESILQNKDEDDYYYPAEKYTFIINLMKRFELCYSIGTEKILVPDLLEIGEPEFNFDYEDKISFLIDYNDFLPKSILPRFIVKMNEDIKGNLRWRTGVVLENKKYDSCAVVKSDDDAKKIYIDVAGTQKRDYFSIILNNFRIINSSFPNLNAIEKVPLPDNPKIAISYLHLIKLESLKKPTYIPEGADREYSVGKLLGNVNVESIIETKIAEGGSTITHIGDTHYHNGMEVIGAQGQNARGNVNMDNFSQIWQVNKERIKLGELAEELINLKVAMQENAESGDQYESITNVVHAKESAEKGDGPITMEYLSKAGKWAYTIADKIGAPMAVAALASALGF